MVTASKHPNRREKLTPRRRTTFVCNACIENNLESQASMGDQNLEDGKFWVVLTREERGTINFIQRRDPEQRPRVNYTKTTQKIGMSEYLRALCRIDLPPNSNAIPQSSINRSLKSVVPNPSS
jgi:hypothetical protein